MLLSHIKTKLKALLSITLLTFMSSVLADTIIPEQPAQTPNAVNNGFPPVNWVSKNNNDMIAIQNGNGQHITILITVNKNPNPSTGADSPGINVKNCGTTLHILPGSTAICQPQDAMRPVTFASDSSTDQASGSYQIKT